MSKIKGYDIGVAESDLEERSEQKGLLILIKHQGKDSLEKA